MIRGNLGLSSQTTAKALTKTPFHAYLDPDDMKALTKCFAKKTFKKGEELPESPFYLLLEGEVQITTPQGHILATKKPGSFFTRNFRVDKVAARPKRMSLFGGNPRAGRRVSNVGDAGGGDVRLVSPAPEVEQGVTFTSSFRFQFTAKKRNSITPAQTEQKKDEEDKKEDKMLAKFGISQIVAKSAGSVLVIPPKGLEKFEKRNAACEGIVRKLRAANIESALKKVPFILDAQLHDGEMRTLGELCAYQALDVGESVFDQGDDSRDFFIVLHGSLDVTVDGTKVATIGEGQYVGERALVLDEKRGATVKAVERSLLVHFNKQSFVDFLKLAPSFETSVLLFCKERMLDTYKKTDVPLFCELSPPKIKQSARVCGLVRFKDEAILTQGEPGKSLFVVAAGEVTVSKSEGGAETFTTTLKPGQYFGELSLVQEESKCAATCRANGSVTLLEMSRGAFLELCSDEPALLAYINIKLLRKNCVLEDVLRHAQARALFDELLKKEFADEHLCFYDAVEEFACMPPGERKAFAERLRDEYVKAGAERQINISDKQRAATLKAIEGADYGVEECKTVFEEAKAECYTLMARDNFRRFVAGEPFAQLLDTLGAYTNVAPDHLQRLKSMKPTTPSAPPAGGL